MAASPDWAVLMEGVGKRYRKLDEEPVLLRALVPFARVRTTPLWAIRNIDLRIGRGEVVGVIGPNGSGKTTLLRMIAGVTRPTEGKVAVAGRVAPLLSVGVGFHRELTGRENVYVNGMLLGLDRPEIDRRFDEIVAFAELEEFIDTPVKFYSSGMFMRLGFSVAVSCSPDILLVDEILAVGDTGFQSKCFDRMREVREAGVTVVVVSHNLNAVRELCPRALLLHEGRVEFQGPTADAIVRYHEIAPTGAASRSDGQEVRGGVRIVGRALLGPTGPTRYTEPDSLLTFQARVEFDRPVDSPCIAVYVKTAEQRVVYGSATAPLQNYRRFEKGDVADISASFVPRLVGGTYRVTITVTSSDTRDILLADSEGMTFQVAGRPYTWGTAELSADVSVDGTPLSAGGAPQGLEPTS